MTKQPERVTLEEQPKRVNKTKPKLYSISRRREENECR